MSAPHLITPAEARERLQADLGDCLASVRAARYRMDALADALRACVTRLDDLHDDAPTADMARAALLQAGYGGRAS